MESNLSETSQKIQELEKRIQEIENHLVIKKTKTNQKKRLKVYQFQLQNQSSTKYQKLFNVFFELYNKQTINEFDKKFSNTSMESLVQLNRELGFSDSYGKSRLKIKENLINKINQKRQLLRF